MSTPQTHHLKVQRTARYITLGTPGPTTKEVWIVCHGYGQLAESFIQGVSAIDDGTRWLVAPEALSRFYLEELKDGRRNRVGPIGGSWMTREDREVEIDDQVAYLTQLHDYLFTQIDRATVTLTVLGFSQGASTTSRWMARTKIRAERLICWGSGLPDDVLAAGPNVFRGIPFWMVIGNRDTFIPAERAAAHRQALVSANFPHQWIDFDGGHRLDNDTLRQLIATS